MGAGGKGAGNKSSSGKGASGKGASGKGAGGKEENKKEEEQRKECQENHEAPECMPPIPPPELCAEEQRVEFRLNYACGAYMTRRFASKSPDDAMWDAAMAMTDLMEFWEECADDPAYYNRSYYQDPCRETIIRDQMIKECRKRVACEPVILPCPQQHQ